MKEHAQNVIEKLVPDPFIKNQNLALLPSVANPNNFLLYVFHYIFVTVPVRICEVLVRPHLYLLAISESRNVDLKSLDIWSAVASGRLCSTKNPDKSTSALTACFSKFWAKMTSSLSISFVLLWHHNTPCVLG